MITNLYLIVFNHSCQTKCWMKNYKTIYKTKVVTSFASCSLGAKHMASKQSLELTIKIVFLPTPKLHHDSIIDKLHHDSKLENGWNFQTSHKTWHAIKHNTCVYKAPTSFTNLMNWKSLLQNPNKSKLGSSL